MAQAPLNYRAVAAQKARQYGIDPGVFQAQIQQESGFNPTAHSGAGAIGIAQIVPKWHPGVNPADPVASLDYAAKWDSQLLKKYGGDWKQTLSVYNSGQPDKYRDPSFAKGQTYDYVRAILGSGQPAAPSPGPMAAALSAPHPAAAAQVAQPPMAAMPASQADPADSRREFARALLGSLGQNGEITNLGGLTAALTQRRASLQAPAPVTQPQPPTAPESFSAPSQPTRTTQSVAPTAAPAANGVVAEASKFIGTPYSWGGGTTSGPSKGIAQGANTVGFDCSALLQFAYAKQGVNIPRTTYDQWKVGHPVDASELQPGDAVFFHPGPNGPEHVGIYMGGGRYLQAPQTGDVVKVSSMSDRGDFMGGRRYA